MFLALIMMFILRFHSMHLNVPFAGYKMYYTKEQALEESNHNTADSHWNRSFLSNIHSTRTITAITT